MKHGGIFMHRLAAYLKEIHKNMNTELEIPPFISISLLMLYIIIAGVFGHIIGMDLFTPSYQSFEMVFDTFFLRILILILYIIFNIAFLYLMILWFRKDRIRIPVLLSYYAIFATAIFFISLILFFGVLALHYVFGMANHPIFIVFGASIVIIVTLLNIYPAYLFFMAIKHRPIDIFWPIILYIIGIHIISFLMFRVWGTVDVIRIWTG